MANVIDTLRGIQKEHGWSDAEMGHELGVSRTLWLAVRNGEEAPRFSTLVLLGALRRWPALSGEVLAFMHAAAQEDKSKGSEVA